MFTNTAVIHRMKCIKMHHFSSCDKIIVK